MDTNTKMRVNALIETINMLERGGDSASADPLRETVDELLDAADPEGPRYLSAEKMPFDDFGVPFKRQVGEVVYDAKTRQGPWATMTQESYAKHGLGRLGQGLGQKYVRNSRGELHKVEG